MYVKFKCDCELTLEQRPALQLKCATHGEEIKDWSSDYLSPLRVVIHWRDSKAFFALHRVTYDARGFIATMSEEPESGIYDSTAELAQEARAKKLTFEQVSDIFYDRYIEYCEFYMPI